MSYRSKSGTRYARHSVDMTGTVVGDWRVVSRAGRFRGSATWDCECTLCGRTAVYTRDQLRPAAVPPRCRCKLRSNCPPGERILKPRKVSTRWVGKSHGVLYVLSRVGPEGYLCRCTRCERRTVRESKSVGGSFRRPAPEYCEHCRPVASYRRKNARGTLTAPERQVCC